ncbi:DUF2577 domain-containing protein [Paenibacillus sp. y28]|uniref:DUF2577 domain-containing protein n=1 Tax=Paenibacillus sp. y28 TaxID=3129110 RepID=UPI00301B2759
MSRMLEIIKKAGVGAVEAGSPVAVMLGTVVSGEPLEIQVDQRFVLTSEFLMLPESLTPYEVQLHHHHVYTDQTTGGTATRITEEAMPDPIVIRKKLEPGDKVLLLRMQGGQQFVVLDRLVSP